jgi:hypothetical protein
LLDIEIRDRVGGVDHHGDLGQRRNDLLEIFEPLADQFETKIGETGGVAAGAADALDQFRPDRIGDIHEHDRDIGGGFLDIGRRTADADQHIGRERYKLGRHAVKLVRLLVGEAMNEFDFSRDVTELSEPVE